MFALALSDEQLQLAQREIVWDQAALSRWAEVAFASEMKVMDLTSRGRRGRDRAHGCFTCRYSDSKTIYRDIRKLQLVTSASGGDRDAGNRDAPITGALNVGWVKQLDWYELKEAVDFTSRRARGHLVQRRARLSS
jgi:hypothetical protein